MTTDKDLVLDKIRLHFLSKYRHQPNITLILDQELQNISSKSTITKSDLDQIDARLTGHFSENISRRKSSSIGPTLKDTSNFSAVKRLQSISPRKEQTDTESVYRPRTKSAVRTRHVHEASFSKVPGPYDASLYYLSPFDKAILNKKNQNVIGKAMNRPGDRINFSFNLNEQIDDDGSDTPMMGNHNRSMIDEHHRQNKSLGPSQNRLRSALPKRDTTIIEKEKLRKDDYWHKIEGFHLQVQENKQKEKEEERKKAKTKWLEDLNKQIEDKKKRIAEEKIKDFSDAQNFIGSQTQIQKAQLEKDKSHQEFVKSREKKNFVSDMQKLMMRNHKKNYDRARDNHDAEKQWERFDEEFEKQKQEKHHSMMNWRIEQQLAITDKGRRLNSVKEQEKQNDRVVMKTWNEKRDQQDAERENYLSNLREKALNRSSQVTSQECWLIPGKREVSLETVPDSDTGLMKFVASDKKSIAKRNRKREEERRVNEYRIQQAREKTAGEANRRKDLNHQQELWKVQEDQMQTREELTKEADRLKRIAQKAALDEQIRIDKMIKYVPLTNKERRFNRSILNQMARESKQSTQYDSQNKSALELHV